MVPGTDASAPTSLTTAPRFSSRLARPRLEILQEGLRLAERALREQGIDPDDVGPPPPPTREQEIAERATRSWTTAAFAVLPGDVRVVIIAAKVGRVLRLVDEDPQDCGSDTALNLLLLEHLLEGLRQDISEMGGVAEPTKLALLEERERLLRGLLAPPLARITPFERVLVATLAAHGRAPSPFSTCPEQSNRGALRLAPGGKGS